MSDLELTPSEKRKADEDVKKIEEWLTSKEGSQSVKQASHEMTKRIKERRLRRRNEVQKILQDQRRDV